ncbi:unnamed protein product [[Candida] boidinii]|nr:unnamed protein product [[Candida] boidinii]
MNDFFNFLDNNPSSVLSSPLADLLKPDEDDAFEPFLVLVLESFFSDFDVVVAEDVGTVVKSTAEVALSVGTVLSAVAAAALGTGAAVVIADDDACPFAEDAIPEDAESANSLVLWMELIVQKLVV